MLLTQDICKEILELTIARACTFLDLLSWVSNLLTPASAASTAGHPPGPWGKVVVVAVVVCHT